MANLLFIAALPQEQQALLNSFEHSNQRLCISSTLELFVHCIPYRTGNIYISLSGMGNVNAGVNLALIFEQLDITQVVLIGVGGALSPTLEIGDMVISDKVIQHDYFSSLDEGHFRMQPGSLVLNEAQADEHHPIMQSKALSFDLAAIRHPKVTVIEALIASGSEFVGTAVRKQHIHNACYNPLLVDMEASAIASIAIKYDKPFVIAKTVSDKLHGDGSIGQDFENFLNNAAHNAALIGKQLAECFFAHSY